MQQHCWLSYLYRHPQSVVVVAVLCDEIVAFVEIVLFVVHVKQLFDAVETIVAIAAVVGAAFVSSMYSVGEDSYYVAVVATAVEILILMHTVFAVVSFVEVLAAELMKLMMVEVHL